MTIEDALKRRPGRPRIGDRQVDPETGKRRPIPKELLGPDQSGRIPSGELPWRPLTYRPEFCEQATKICALGATDPEIADFFEVNVRTVQRWRHDFPEFAEATRVGKDVADDRVERSLYHRANGYTYETVKIFMPAGAVEPVIVPYTEHIPPDPTSMIFWLKNRRRWQWSDRVNHEHTGPDGGPIQISEVRRVIVRVDKTEERDLFDGVVIEGKVESTG